jgi:hypothetical protein
MRKTIANICKALSSFPGLSAVLECENESLQFQKGPVNKCTLIYMLRKLVLLDKPISTDPPIPYDESHYVNTFLGLEVAGTYSHN